MQGPPTEGLQMIVAGCLDSWFCHDTLISPAPLARDLQLPWSAGRSARAILQAGGHGFESRRLHYNRIRAAQDHSYEAQ
jgi:hypothetical protein